MPKPPKLLLDPKDIFPGVPSIVSRSCMDNYDGIGSAMYALWQSKPFDPRKLYNEADQCLLVYSPETLTSAGEGLKAIRDWAEKLVRKAEAEEALSAAAKLAKAAGIDRQDAMRRIVDIYEGE